MAKNISERNVSATLFDIVGNSICVGYRTQEPTGRHVVRFGMHTTNTESNDDTERRIDEALEESFPASDAPCFVGAGASPGRHIAPRKKPGDFGQYQT